MRYLALAGIISFLLTACGSAPQSKNKLTVSDSTRSVKQGAFDTNWVNLFDGKTLNGWHSYGDSSAGNAWNIDDGAIHLKPGEKKGYQTQGGGDLISKDTFGNFDLTLRWKVAKNTNSGILFYVQDDKKKYPETWYTGPEIQVLDVTGAEDAHSPKHQVADLYDLIACKTHPGMPPGLWNETEIISDHGKLEVILNRVSVLTTTLWDDNWKKLIAGSKFKNMPGFGTFTSGHIALQDHGGEVWYKDVQVRKL
ncbi:MAG TPA: DUF1080 domain-containing protein [Chitinophagaceae bacterium]|nr:DUF1080 domain-containing protein [Chitinophagaceae bacterium]